MASLWNSAKHNRSTLTKTMRYWSPHVQGNQHRFWPWPAFVYPSWIMLSKKTSAASANIIYTILMGFYTRIQFTQNNHKRNSNKLRKPDDNKKHKKQTNSKRTCLLQFSCSLVVLTVALFLMYFRFHAGCFLNTLDFGVLMMVPV